MQNISMTMHVDLFLRSSPSFPLYSPPLFLPPSLPPSLLPPSLPSFLPSLPLFLPPSPLPHSFTRTTIATFGSVLCTWQHKIYTYILIYIIQLHASCPLTSVRVYNCNIPLNRQSNVDIHLGQTRQIATHASESAGDLNGV